MDGKPRGRKPGKGLYQAYVPQVAVTTDMRVQLDEIIANERIDMSEIIRFALSQYIADYNRTGVVKGIY